jgi:hypothetical protein
VFHLGLVDLLRSLLLLPLALSILSCRPIYSCNIIETSFLVLVTASTVREVGRIREMQNFGGFQGRC